MIITLVMDQFDVEGNGITVASRRLAETLEKRGHTVRIVTTGEEGKNRYIVKEKRDLVQFFAKKQKMSLGKPDREVLIRAFKGADIIHFMMPFFLSIEGKKIADEMNIPTTTAFHVQPENVSFNIGMGNNKIVNDFIYAFFNETFYKNFNYIHCPSRFIAEELKNHGYKSKLYVISNGVDSIFKMDDKFIKDEKYKDKFVILMIGRYSPEKRQDVLIDAISKSKYKDKIQLILAGTGPSEKTLKKLSDEKLKNKTIFNFYLKENLLKIIRNTDLYVHASEIEIEAISCIEAFSCGIVPIISNSKKSATKQFALSEKSLFKTNDSSDLANKIDYWIEHSEEKQQLGYKYAQFAEKYNLEKSIDEILEMFNDAISSK
ncbi:MAG: glycosyltransferase [Clostridia bacterium]